MARIFRRIRTLVVLAGLASVCSPAASSAQERVLRIEFLPDGTMNLSASRVSVRDIVAEWARLCDCYIVNGDKLSAAILPVPVEFVRTPQSSVIESLLRGTTGYALTPRRDARVGASRFETIYIVASSQASAASAPTAPMYQPPIQAPVATPMFRAMPTQGAPEDEIPPVQPGQNPTSRPASAPEPATEAPAQQSVPSTGGVSVPMVVVPITPARGQSPAPGPAPGMPAPMPTPQPQQLPVRPQN